MSSVDLNRIADKLKREKSIGVGQDGKLIEDNPNNNGTNENKKGETTLNPQRFFTV